MKNFEHAATSLALTASLVGGAAPDVLAPKHEAPAHSQEISPAGERSLGSTAMGPEISESTLIGSEITPDGRTQIDTHRVSVPVERPYARHFSASPAAHEVPSAASMQPVKSLLFDLKTKGQQVEAVRAQGFASEEAQMPQHKGAASAGVAIENPENVELANSRRDATIPVVEQAVAEVTGKQLPVTPEQGKEVVRPEVAREIEALAEKYNTTPLDLSRKFNLNQSVPADVAQALSVWKGDRRTDVTITSSHRKPTGFDVNAQPGGDSAPTPTTIPPNVLKKTPAGDEAAQGDRTPVVAPPVARTIPSDGTSRSITEKDAILDGAAYPVDDVFARRGAGTQQNVRISTKAQGNFKAQKQIQPREFNMGKNRNMVPRGAHRGRVGRSHGGNRG